jgi:hypothetical protein
MESRLEDRVQTFLEGLVMRGLRVVRRDAMSDLVGIGLRDGPRLDPVRLVPLLPTPVVASLADHPIAGLQDH